jgi:hypothetical protein
MYTVKTVRTKFLFEQLLCSEYTDVRRRQVKLTISIFIYYITGLWWLSGHLSCCHHFTSTCIITSDDKLILESYVILYMF